MKTKWRTTEESKNFRDKKFQNLSPTPALAEGVSYSTVLREYWKKPPTVNPAAPVPHVVTNLRQLNTDVPVVVWFGHSSYLIRYKQLSFLIDPVFSGHASPMRSMVKAFAGADVYKPEHMPDIDVMIITHNHYDHLDKHTIAALQHRTKKYYTSLGVGKNIACFVTGEKPIQEMDWWETETIAPGITITATPARHFSGRGLVRNESLWSSFVLQLDEYKLYLGGDSGYDTHFREIGEKYGPFDMALLECGQYNTAWPYIHMMPEQTAQAAMDVKAKVLMPVHWAKFRLAIHPWNEPIQRVTAAAAQLNLPLATPMIGEPVYVGKSYPTGQWWK
ncbi:L-ascorbate metabolism protein UlaG (beta-lactamase superfamily) [Filimonas zeae]|uniref:MBL fold metallo-hydrolase n=1 Tax=Filimonas zeae TaxID=1737353 RepID=A0A917J074_9BACT|nr:MBL fold metallo-hydrolase [Filimonas zeae]MDR6338338.1 L-ascorbate metabolism protein UlaG (beta-lactamase superfamily) [Filimonas zeae]GGH68729.1 MBL fold metallo-hydrolase [Filimonas zeae]